jgi:GxxExxY protein
MSEEKRDPRTFAIIGAAMEAHRQFGCGFLKSVYQESLAWELGARSLEYKRFIFTPQITQMESVKSA